MVGQASKKRRSCIHEGTHTDAATVFNSVTIERQGLRESCARPLNGNEVSFSSDQIDFSPSGDICDHLFPLPDDFQSIGGPSCHTSDDVILSSSVHFPITSSSSSIDTHSQLGIPRQTSNLSPFLANTTSPTLLSVPFDPGSQSTHYCHIQTVK